MDDVRFRGPALDGDGWVGWVWAGRRTVKLRSSSREAVERAMHKHGMRLAGAAWGPKRGARP